MNVHNIDYYTELQLKSRLEPEGDEYQHLIKLFRAGKLAVAYVLLDVSVNMKIEVEMHKKQNILPSYF